QYGAGHYGAALRTYARAYRQATGGERRTILDLILTCARRATDKKEVGAALEAVVQVDPDIAFQRFDYAVAEPWRWGHGLLGAASPEVKRRVLEVDEKRWQVVLGSGHCTAAQKQTAEQRLTEARHGLALLETAPELVFTLALGEPAELLRRAAGTEEPKRS